MAELAHIEKEEWLWFKERVQAHEAELKTLRRTMSNIQMSLDDLSKWKDDSKVHEIAALKGRLKKQDKLKDRILFALLLAGGVEVVRLVVDHFASRFH
jgi:Holliday junction resolvase RusA-like endonuclease